MISTFLPCISMPSMPALCRPRHRTSWQAVRLRHVDKLRKRTRDLGALAKSRASVMAKRLLDERCSVTGGRRPYQFQLVFRHHPFMRLVIISDAVLQHTSSRRQRARDTVGVPERGGGHPGTILHPDGLSHRKKMRGGVASDGTGVAFQDAGSAHNSSRSFRVRFRGLTGCSAPTVGSHFRR